MELNEKYDLQRYSLSEPLVKADLKRGHLVGKTLRQASFVRSEFEFLTLIEAHVAGSRFLHCRLTRSDFNQTVFEDCYFNDVTFDGCGFRETRFKNCIVENSRFEGEIPEFEGVLFRLMPEDHPLFQRRDAVFKDCVYDGDKLPARLVGSVWIAPPAPTPPKSRPVERPATPPTIASPAPSPVAAPSPAGRFESLEL